MLRTLALVGMLLIFTGLLAGCGSSTDNTPQGGKQPIASESKKEHGHDKAGAHGGLIVEIGHRDSYHAEVVLEKGGIVRLFTLGKDEGMVQEVESQTLNAYVKLEGSLDSVPMPFEAKPLPEDKPGKSSQFVGMLPMNLWGKSVTVSVPIAIDQHRYRFSFTLAKGGHEGDQPMKLPEDEEKTLYLKPGGKYTEADIQANGNRTASMIYDVTGWPHSLKAKAGEKICPVTKTKANPKCTWIIAGKVYQFCCPPCIDNFVQTAKDNPEEILDPETYVNKE